MDESKFVYYIFLLTSMSSLISILTLCTSTHQSPSTVDLIAMTSLIFAVPLAVASGYDLIKKFLYE